MLNKWVGLGRICQDIELKQTPNGVNVATFSLAVNRNYNKDITDFINIVAWRQTADFVAKYFNKGDLICIEGAIQTRNYEDKQGNKRVAFEVLAEQVYFAGGKKEKSNKPAETLDIDEFEEIKDDGEPLPF